MEKNITLFVITVCLMTVFLGCANQITLTGGEKDTTPPQIDSLKSDSNFQVNFSKKNIQLKLNEFIDLDNPSKNIIVSPPLQYGLEVKHRGKKIYMAFDDREKFLDSTTYIIFFGSAIRDFTERNAMKNYSFVFSTGTFIDSLYYSGSVVDAKTLDPLEDIDVLLYSELSDSAVYKERPNYIAKTNKDGTFKFKNLREDTFRIIAIDDKNLNYRYDKKTEGIGFVDQRISISANDTSLNTPMRLSQVIPKPVLKTKEILYKGHIQLVFDSDPKGIFPSILGDSSAFTRYEKNTITMWIDTLLEYPLNIELNNLKYQEVDTIQIRNPRLNANQSYPKLNYSLYDVESGILHPDDTLKLQFNLPIKQVYHSFIFIDSTSIEAEQIIFDNSKPDEFKIVNKWSPNTDYTVVLDSLAILDIYGRFNDSSGVNFEAGRQNMYGNIQLNIENLPQNSQLIVTLYNDNKPMKQEIFTKNEAISFTKLLPGTYQLEVVKDDNRNNEWDTGDFDAKTQPEAIFYFDLNPVSENKTELFTIDYDQLRFE